MAADVCTSSSGVLPFIGQAVTVVGGWVVVHKLSVARDRDKARREMVAKSADTLNDQVALILLDANKYHQEVRDVGLEIKLKMSLQDASARINALSAICNNATELAYCRSAALNLKQSITGQHFEDEHTTPLIASDLQVQAIAAECMRLKQALLKLKHVQFSDRQS
jgi:hypothetical protein